MASTQQAFGNMVIWASDTDLATIHKEINASVWGHLRPVREIWEEIQRDKNEWVRT